LREKKQVIQTYLGPNDSPRVFDDGSLLSYSDKRRAWVFHKDGFEVILRDSVLPQPEEVYSWMRDCDQDRCQKLLDKILRKILPERNEDFYTEVKMFLYETMLGLVETPNGCVPAYDVEHIRALLEDQDEDNNLTEELLKMIVAESYASTSGFFLHVPPTEEEQKEGTNEYSPL
tara:strand:- start:1560 stop:2081 length:522 start_codon:yes stop_codon:yes gene_type:complete